MFPVAGRGEELGAHHRRGRQRDEEGDDDSGAERDGELAEEPSDDAPHEQDGDEDGHERGAHGEDGEADLGGALERRFQRTQSVLEMAGDVLDDHDGVVDDEAGGDGQRHEREVVERVAEQVHHAERADERERHGHAGDDGGPAASQKRENDQDDQGDGDDQRALDIENRGADGGGAVEHDVEVDRGGNGRAQLRQERTDAVDGADDVRSRLPEEDEGDGRFAIDRSGTINVLDRVRHLGNLGENDRLAVARGDDEAAVLVGFEELIVRVDDEGAVGAGDGALGPVGVCAAESRANGVETDVHPAEQQGIRFDADGGPRAAADVDLADAVDL